MPSLLPVIATTATLVRAVVSTITHNAIALRIAVALERIADAMEKPSGLA